VEGVANRLFVTWGEDFGCMVAQIAGLNPALGMDVCIFVCMLRYLKQRPWDELITQPRSPAMCMCVRNKCLSKTVTVVTLGGGGGVCQNILFLPASSNAYQLSTTKWVLILIQYFRSCYAKEVEVFKGLFPWWAWQNSIVTVRRCFEQRNAVVATLQTTALAERPRKE
jgi:hypothetical protein